MYGMVNKFISTTVINRYGQTAWDQINNKLENSAESFIEMQPYGDEVTFGIVGASIEHLGVDLATFLRQMGEDWVAETARGSYQSMYSLVDGGVFEFLSNLNNMHQVISAQLTELIPPSFLCKKDESGNITVQYFSSRAGLEPFVEGLLMGVCHHFNASADVATLSVRSESQPFSVFSISFK
ncbi:MAG TPA: heme NO-binding domain-containing protein [Pseudomonadales bacterium]|nr:heme NO-binding domain-containing protein [Pseudomonadales bacterium]